MAEVIRMPKMSDTMIEGVIAKWLVKVGDKVKPGDIIAEVETDKATMELENYESGTILHISVPDKGTVPVNGIIAIVGQPGEDFSALLTSTSNASTSKPSASPATTSPSSDIKATVIRMPKMSDTMKEGVIAKWLVKVGDKIKPGDIIAEVETDKATMELENYESGTLLYIGVEEGKPIPVDGIIAIVGEPGTDYTPLLQQSPTSSSKASTTNGKETTTSPVPAAPSIQNTSVDAQQKTKGRIFASPLAKKIASERGLDISQIPGTGENGRIIKRDVENYQPAAKVSSIPTVQQFVEIGKESFTEEPVSQMRKTIARRLSESLFTSPHFYVTMEINMDKAIQARTVINESSPVKISFNDMIIKATAIALKKHPKVNSSWLGDKIRYNQHIHIGVAVAVEEGLLVPVVRFADQKSLSQISAEVKELGAKAKSKKLQPSDWEGNTFTISNLGMFGVEEFTAIINPPDACILAVGSIKETPIVRNGQIVIGNVMKVTLSSDHRIVDGAIAAAFLKTLKELLEEPYKLLI
ncbi:MAG: pyruvate dehydrogenase complex dihydrolipoamide acetyltransferase [Cytophagales bacterium]|nr:pyruvate dehydrogenase complex dihydrolipoamide acetyltransferase [Cytophagales bacterium]MDW8383931.1 pyruvate dehydrogenase complex dihydrolipoamide acetyltransferase [Flammeovirgaceae bacterium]